MLDVMSVSTPTPQPPRALEAQCQATIVEAAKLLGYLVHAERPAQRQSGRWSTAIQGDAGFPDLVMVHPIQGVLVFAELKRKPNDLTAAQQLWRAGLQIANVGCHVVWVPEQVDRFIADMARWARGETS